MSAIIVAAAAATATAASAAETTATLGFRPGFVHGQRTSAGIATVQGGDGSVGFVVIRHFDKTESPRPARVAIRDYGGAVNGAMRLKPLPQVSFSGTKSEISNKYLFHRCSFQI
jgi:hypothetical protein